MLYDSQQFHQDSLTFFLEGSNSEIVEVRDDLYYHHCLGDNISSRDASGYSGYIGKNKEVFFLFPPKISEKSLPLIVNFQRARGLATAFKLNYCSKKIDRRDKIISYMCRYSDLYQHIHNNRHINNFTTPFLMFFYR